MNRLFAELVNSQTPKFNPHIVNGLACYYVPFAQEWLHSIFLSASKSFPKGLMYHGCERCTPQEEYNETTRVRNNKRTFDLAESDLFLLKLKFSFEGEDGVRENLPDRYMYIPFVEDAGIFRLSGTMYHITGVLSDKIISPGQSSIFVKLIRGKLTFRHTGHSVLIGNERQTFNVVWSSIYRQADKNRSAAITTHAESSVAHYLFAKYGFTETFQKYAGFVPTVGHYDPTVPPAAGNILCRSSYFGTRAKPATFMGFDYKPSNLYLEVPEKHWNSTTAALVAGFFYVVDHFPERIEAYRVDDKFLWSVLLGHIIFSGVYSEARLYSNIEEHFTSLDDYLDVIIQDKLAEIGWKVDNFYDLMAKIMSEFPNLLLGSKIDVNSMFSKNIEILYYMLAEIAFKIFRVNYQLRKSKSKKPLTVQSVAKAFNKIMTPKPIFHLSKDKMICETVSYCGDHKFFKLTSKITEQESGSSKFRKKAKRQVLSENNHFHWSMAEAGNALFLSKSNPMPNTRINPYVQIDLNTGTLIRNERFRPQLERLQEMLTRTSASMGEEIPVDDIVENDDEVEETDLDLIPELEVENDSETDD